MRAKQGTYLPIIVILCMAIKIKMLKREVCGSGCRYDWGTVIGGMDSWRERLDGRENVGKNYIEKDPTLDT
jgi:hypothetical protein